MHRLHAQWISSGRKGSKAFQGFFALLLGLGVFDGVAPPVQASEPAPKELIAQFEMRFLEGMIDHHTMAVHMAALCEQKAQHPKLLTLCQAINTSQQHEIEHMQGWLKAWYESRHEPQMNERDERQMAQLASLNGNEFEVQFMEQMNDHHWQAIVESSPCLLEAYHEDLENLCQDIILAQAKEIRQMQKWLCQWYGLCEGEANHGAIPSNESLPNDSSENSF